MLYLGRPTHSIHVTSYNIVGSPLPSAWFHGFMFCTLLYDKPKMTETGTQWTMPEIDSLTESNDQCGEPK